MKSSVEDHGYQQLDTDNRINTTTIEISGNSLSNATFDRLLTSIKSLNESINADEIHVLLPKATELNCSTSKIATFGRINPISLRFYADGILMLVGPFRYYSDQLTLNCLQDILDGYFPSELQEKFPLGVPIHATDFRQQNFIKKCAKEFLPLLIPGSHFVGGGKLLGSKYCISKFVVDREKIDYGLSFIPHRKADSKILCPIENQSNEQKLINKLSKSKYTFGDLLSQIKQPSKRLDVFKKMFSSQEETAEKVLAKVNLVSTELSEANMLLDEIDLKIRSLSGENFYSLSVRVSDTVATVFNVLEKYISDLTPNSYDLIFMSDHSSDEVTFNCKTPCYGLTTITLYDKRDKLFSEVGICQATVLFMKQLNKVPTVHKDLV